MVSLWPQNKGTLLSGQPPSVNGSAGVLLHLPPWWEDAVSLPYPRSLWSDCLVLVFRIQRELLPFCLKKSTKWVKLQGCEYSSDSLLQQGLENVGRAEDVVDLQPGFWECLLWHLRWKTDEIQMKYVDSEVDRELTKLLGSKDLHQQYKVQLEGSCLWSAPEPDIGSKTLTLKHLNWWDRVHPLRVSRLYLTGRSGWYVS